MLRDLLQCEGHAGPQAYLYVDGQDGHRSVALRCLGSVAIELLPDSAGDSFYRWSKQ